MVLKTGTKHLDKGIASGDIDISFQLTTMKLFHANWLIDLYNQLTSPRVKDVIIRGWKKSGICDALKLGSRGLPSIDAFKEWIQITLYKLTLIQYLKIINMILLRKKKYVTHTTDSEWEEADNRNGFDIFF